MDEPLFEIENWRDGWYYRFGSRYTGPFRLRCNAIAAAETLVEPLSRARRPLLRASLTSAIPASSVSLTRTETGTPA
ncbi:hypothetical protein OEG84_22245 [Hoeflea sp. G2-23]|uniref:Uncharacterized protein n=1 Tax=Hoeflea algicola TaxID=2983763 RepID=A0ABT3ZEX6_9HYPH|nr:hypothetical protein [Hoeflea algicola]MCY0150350.1 hypothetical protein [Hoeflea algicola]